VTASASHSLRFSHRLEYGLVVGVRALLRLVPERWHNAVCRGVAWFWQTVAPIRRAVVLDNLRRAFPDRPAAWHARVARDCVAHFAYMFGFFPLIVEKGGAAALERLVARVEGEEYGQAGGIGNGPSIMASAHFGNWELAIDYLTAHRHLKAAAVAKPMHNPLVEELVARNRRRFGWDIISTREDPIRPLLQGLRDGLCMILLADQDARREGIFLPFFGHPASTPVGPALLACRFKIPLTVGLARRDPVDGRHYLRYYPPLFPDPAADRKTEVERLTRAYLAYLEEAIREHPEQYFWFHKRWKTQPPAPQD
jgi:KDO2-lipid IV(A) lauroyltransferase